VDKLNGRSRIISFTYNTNRRYRNINRALFPCHKIHYQKPFNAMSSIDRERLTARHHLASLAGRLAAQIDGVVIPSVGGSACRLVLADLKPVRARAGWLYFAVAIGDPAGMASRTPLAMGIVSGGGRGVSPWFELRLYPTVTLADGSTFDARAAGLEAAFIKLLGRLIPPGGHLMIEYESPGQSATHAELLLRVPPAATYLGFLMFQAGFRGEFKDWYIAEGGHEGPRKLQANKSPTPAAARAASRANRAALAAFMRRPLPTVEADSAALRPCRERARAILRQLR
jgi:hypothetical protein